jgi:hypothetical protein
VGVAGLVLGIIGTILSIIPPLFYIGIPLGIIGLILSIVGRKAAMTNNQPTGSATAGLVLSVIALVIGGAMYVTCTMCIKKMGDDLSREMEKAMKDPKLNKEFDDAFKKAMEEAAKKQQEQK